MVLIGSRGFLGAVGMVSAGVLAGCTTDSNDSAESITGNHNTQSQPGGTGGGGRAFPLVCCFHLPMSTRRAAQTSFRLRK